MVTQRGSKRINVADSPSGKKHLLRVLRSEADGFFELAIGADDAGWQAPTPCEGWEVRDIVGHMVDVSQTYLGRYYAALEGWHTPDAPGLRGYARAIFDGAMALHGVPQYELIGRLKASWDRLDDIWDGLSDEQWAGLNIPHKFAGPVPQFMMPVFQLMDFTYHSWDLRKALGRTAVLGEEGSGTLVPFMIMLRRPSGSVRFTPQDSSESWGVVRLKRRSSDDPCNTLRNWFRSPVFQAHISCLPFSVKPTE